MADKSATAVADDDATAVAAPRKRAQTRVQPAPPRPKMLPPYKVLLHNDDENEMQYVVQTILMLTPLNPQDAILRMLEAHERGCALLLVTHKERAELYAEQFASRKLVVTIEPDA